MDIEHLKNKIFKLSKKLNQVALKKVLEYEDGIIDYTLIFKIWFFIDDSEVAQISEDLKPYFLNDISSDMNSIPNYLYTILSSKSELTEETISEINSITFDIEISYKYRYNMQTL